ncbi:putative glycosyltransferase [Actinoplanes missouriensis 431]|uniref:Putative glycosyltransferase n=1 Tax=Actinoplanes missouriensis (strain ATCC 14538 / DSM 43046 / CBS 188.64 / JCM 3121 / NBRC 102363 / NCIMB 12654 / NRRL B-3342 / UNCC 431) TaxID=512565 RepID=I0GX89_ACTM4|nr:stealth conserved region 3 domain-containing protein [Actinoplanes missouriensis]BAL85376.1 putative glycosyltransferase [Actinoplanes missouriensis 431]
MKITFLLTWGDAMGGTERAVLRQANWLAQRHEIEVVSVFRTRDVPAFEVDPRVRMTYLVDTRDALHRPAGRELSDEVCRVLSATRSELVRPEWEQAFTRLSDLELERVLRETTADIVVSTTPALMAVMAELVPRRVVTVHQEHRVAELRGSSGNPLKIFSARLDAIVLLSEPTRAWFASRFGDASPRLEIIPNSIDDGYRPRSSRTNPSVVMAGRLTGEKQFGHAVSAFSQLAADHPDWSLRIFGDGARGELENQIAALGLGEQVQLMGPTTTIENEWAKASVAMVTSRVESFGLTIVEAMAAGVPVVSYDCPNGPREIIEHGRTGFLVPPADIDALAAALREVIEDEQLRHDLGETAAVEVERFSPDVVMTQWERLYTELLTGQDGPGWRERRAFALALHQAQSTATGVVATTPPVTTADSEIETWTAEVNARYSDLVWSRGQLTQVRDDTAPYETAKANLDLTVTALEAAGVDYFLVRQTNPTYRVAVRDEDRVAALTALGQAARHRPAYIEAFDGRHRTLGNWPAAFSDTVEQLRTAASVRIFEPIITGSWTLRLGAIYGCELEFWVTSEDGAELSGPAPTLAGNPLAASSLTPALINIGGREYHTVKPFTHKLVSDLTFPIDAVYTWVDGDDPAWLRRKADALGERYTGDHANESTARFRSRDELRYSLRSIDLFAPWVNRIWIVTDGQTPEWLDTSHPRIRVVDHREIFSEPGFLPTFNSHAIETQLHHIEGLSEHFLYLNDDVFFGRLLGPNMFFNAGGLPKTFGSRTQIPLTPINDTDEAYAVAAKNNRALLEQGYGRTLTHGFLHTPHAHRRSTLSAIEDEFSAAVQLTAQARIRSTADVSMLSSLGHHYGLVTGRAVEGSIRCGFINVGLAEHQPRLKALLQKRAQDVFCLNDYHDSDIPPEDQARIIEAFLAAYFPIPSQFEKGSARNRRG